MQNYKLYPARYIRLIDVYDENNNKIDEIREKVGFCRCCKRDSFYSELVKRLEPYGWFEFNFRNKKGKRWKHIYCFLWHEFEGICKDCKYKISRSVLREWISFEEAFKRYEKKHIKKRMQGDYTIVPFSYKSIDSFF